MTETLIASTFWLLSFGAIGKMLLQYREAQRVLANANPAAHYSDLEARLDIAREEIARLEAARQLLEPTKLEIEQLQLRRQSLLDEVTTLEGQRKTLQDDLQNLEPDRQRLEQTRIALGQEIEQLADARQKHSDSLKDAEVTKAVVAGLQETKRQIEEAVHKLENKLVDLDSKEKQLSQKTASLELECSQRQQAAKASADNAEDKLSEVKESLRQAHDYWKNLKRETEEFQAKAINLKEEIKFLERKKADFEAVTGPVGGQLDLSKTLEDLAQPTLKFAFTGRAQFDEPTALGRFREHLTKKALHYSERVQLAFHTSLKAAQINPLVVLAGVSGTGKSALPMAYAEALGMNFLSLAVQPGWSGPQDLLGFYNYLERKYKATELARALAQMSRFSSEDLPRLPVQQRKDQMLLLLLDEMNLARIEYYFSDFLSRLEQRRGRKIEDPQRRHEVSLLVDAGSLPAGEVPRFIFPDFNVLFVGTMNEDESTQSLSDKVIDRANVLRFGAPRELMATHAATVAPTTDFLPRTKWEEWTRSFDGTGFDNERTILIQLNKTLETVNRPFGHRVYRAILDYIANYPKATTDATSRRYALSDQIEQKIIPKLRGLDTQDDTTSGCLDQLGQVITGLQDVELAEAFNRARAQHLFEWFGVKRS